jgi:hypothetical protein
VLVFQLDSFDPRSFSPISWAPADESHLTDDELREEYHGHGRVRRSRRGTLHREPRYTNEDVERLVRDKWEAIERAQELAQKPAEPSTHQPAPVEKPPAIEQVVSLAFPAKPIAEVPRLTAAVDKEATQARRLRMQREEAAIALVLGELA